MVDTGHAAGTIIAGLTITLTFLIVIAAMVISTNMGIKLKPHKYNLHDFIYIYI